MLIKAIRILVTAIVFSPGLSAQTLTQTQARTGVCGSTNYFLSSVDSVRNLLDTLSTSRLPPGARATNIKRTQCGLPGESWNICLECDDKKNKEAFQKVVPMLASAEHRDWHKEWHRIRQELNADGMNRQPPEPATIAKWKKQKSIPDDVDKFTREHRDNGTLAGEDFFYMHRQMIKMVQIEMTDAGEACMSPWTSLPASVLDSEWPVPRAVNTKNPKFIAAEKQMLEEINEASKELLKPENLKGKPLSKLGLEVQSQIHGQLHTLYAGVHRGCNGNTDNSLECDDLTDDRSSHVNIYFWKLHGYIDNFVGAWLKANNYDSIATDCTDDLKSGKRCYEWKGTWLGRLPNVDDSP